MRRLTFFLVFTLVIVSVCSADTHTTVKPAVPKAWTQADIDAVVDTELKSIYSPAPTENGQPPAECDDIRYFVLTPKSLDADPDVILTLSPGMNLGAGELSHLARNLIYIAKTEKNVNVKVLIIERRDNCLEDLTGVNAAEEARDIQVAIDYYYNGTSVDGKTFQGFVTSDQAPYLSEFGIKLNVEDIYTVITTEVPDPAVRRQKLFMAGHSISGWTLGIFAGWDFDGNPATLDDAGYRNCAGFIALDTLIAPMTEVAEGILQLVPKMLANRLQAMMRDSAGYAKELAKLRSGKWPCISSEQQSPEYFMLMELGAMLADWAPNQKSTLFEKVPYSKMVHQYLNAMLSGTYLEAMQPNSYKRINCTNLALAGLQMDNNFTLLGAFALSMGFLGNGPVADKTFPIPAQLEQNPSMADLLRFMPLDLYYPTAKNRWKPYQWINSDEILASQYAVPEYEVVDIYDYVRAVYAGPSNYFEWYFPNRLLFDVIYVSENMPPTDGISFQHPDFKSKVPILTFFSGNSTLIAPSIDISKHDHIYLEGYTHTDPVMAAANRLEGRPNEVIGPMIDFMLSNSQAQ